MKTLQEIGKVFITRFLSTPKPLSVIKVSRNIIKDKETQEGLRSLCQSLRFDIELKNGDILSIFAEKSFYRHEEYHTDPYGKEAWWEPDGFAIDSAQIEGEDSTEPILLTNEELDVAEQALIS